MYILFDIGGTKTRVAASDDGATFGTPVKFETPKDFECGIAAIVSAAHTLIGDRKVTAIAGGIRGPLNHDHTTIVSESVLTDWIDKPIAETLREALGAPVYLANDAALAALGEAHYGAGKGYPIVAYHTVSTGVGGARVADGRIDHAASGFEPGKQVIDPDRTLCPWAKDGTLESMVSGTALQARFGKKPYDIPQSDGVWDELAGYLAYGLKNTIVYWSPDVIVLGGSMVVGDPRILLADIVRHTKAVVGGEVPVPPIVDAAFRDDGGLYGALALIKERNG